MVLLKRSLVLFLFFVLFLPHAVADVEENGLSVSIEEAAFSDSWKGKTEESYKWYIVDVTISNWSATAYALSESVQCRLLGQGTYVIGSDDDFENSTIEPFTRISGHFVFKVPNMIVDGRGGPLVMELNTNGNITTGVIVDAPPTEAEYQSQKSDGGQLEMAVQKAPTTKSHTGNMEPGYVWLEYEITLTNTASNPYELSEPLLYSLKYEDSFIFAGETESTTNCIDAFASVSNSVSFKVPNLVATAQSGELVLEIKGSGLQLDYVIPQDMIAGE